MRLIFIVDPVNFITSDESGQIPIQSMSASDEFLCELGFWLRMVNYSTNIVVRHSVPPEYF